MLLAVLATVLAQSADSATLRHSNGLVPPAITAVRVDHPPTLDGRLDDPVWALATPVTELIQSDPDEGKPVSEATAVRIVYDADALYVGARLFDSEPRRIARQLGRRDSFTQSDDFVILLDSYHDHRTAFRFDVNPAGVKGDVLTGDEGRFWDNSWDPVWDVATSVDSLGWTAEMRIPFSQLRFSRAQDQVWGVRLVRIIQRKNEFSLFPFVGKTESGFVSRFAHIVGLRDIPAPRRLELLPYAVGRGSYHTPDVAGNPFDDGSNHFGGAGLDLKYGVTSNLTLDAAINPDFGQVEIDPAFVNLTAFEQFLEERRPFFIEGADIFSFRAGGESRNEFVDTPQFFYSRRIGRPPQGYATSPGQFVDTPDNTTILSAAKLTGKTAGGWSVGVLDAVTARERATVADTLTGARSRDEVEPATNYFVGRLKRDFQRGNTGLALLATAVNRNLDTRSLDFLRAAAYAGGVDFFHRWHKNTYVVSGTLGGSYIRGDTLAIQLAQRSSNRYYQRPDASGLRYDPTRTSLAGLTAELYIDKVAGNWLWGVAGSTTTPGFEVNDLGFHQRVDRIVASASVSRRWTRPGKVFRQAAVNLFAAPRWNYDGDPVRRALLGFGFGQFRNYWGVEFNFNYRARVLDDRLTRGGPLAEQPAWWELGGGFFSDDRKRVTGNLFASYSGDQAGGWSVGVFSRATVRPSGAVSLSLRPAYVVERSAAQYVRRVSDTTAGATLGARYVFAQLLQHSLNVSLRLNLTVSPTLSFQLFTQPFTFSGDYQAFKDLRARKTFAFNTYGRDNGSTITYDQAAETYTVDPDGGGPAAPFAIGNPDFRVRSFRSNAVLRWEYRPGSTLFVVWTQNRSGFFPFDPDFDLGRDLGRELFKDRPTNVLLVKLNYWLSL